MKKYDISKEDYRSYVYPNGDTYVISYPKTLYIAESGGHRVVDSKGEVHCPVQPWLAIVWFPERATDF